MREDMNKSKSEVASSHVLSASRSPRMLLHPPPRDLEFIPPPPADDRKADPPIE